MKALKHLADRFSFVWNNSKKMNVTQKDIEAINILIQEENSKKRNESLEDALILFYLLKVYKVHNENNKLILKNKNPEEIGFPMGLPEASDILNRLAILLNPKHEVIKMIADELWLYQEYERMPKDKQKWLDDMERISSTHGETVHLSSNEYIPIPEDQRITFEQVEALINDSLKKAKENFPKFKILHSDHLEFIETKPLNSENPDRWQ